MSFQFSAGKIPLLVSFPHNGSAIPDSVLATMTDSGKTSVDTDWFLDRLYDLPELAEASKIVASTSRYVIDLNRSSDNQSLYPGQVKTGLIPEQCFDGSNIYINPPGPVELQNRIESIWYPYHQQISRELARMKKQFGLAVLLDAHSIASKVPRLFQGRIPDFNLGTNAGKSCDATLEESIALALSETKDFSHVVNERFIGGFITRNYGQPKLNQHAVQIELSQATYLDESNKSWDAAKAKRVQPLFQQIISAIVRWIEKAS